ncbi:MAG TPA: DUF5011 domain-containing protein [Bacteroidia bacterium]|nr:DUF5011 domain-containing protein [Bacteroidia bacterium]HRH07196.1 DUF5011 domain-containing protein [Bacteroidia bacterium]
MKKNILLLSSALLFGATVFLIGCKKDDTTAPVVTLNGDAAVTISLQGTYTELGATANDDEDGSITVVTTGSVDKNKTGDYVITYSATDAAGNEGTATRTVTVKNDAAYLNGTYTTTEGNPVTSTWTQTVTASTTVNNRLEFSKFANYSNNTTIRANLVGNEVSMISTVATGIGTSGCTHSFISVVGGNPVVKNTTTGKYSFSIRFTDEQQAGGAGCTATSAQLYEDSFTQN